MQKCKEEMRKMEQYAEAVASALAGNQEGYDFLYQSTYQKKFFIAKKYMGNPRPEKGLFTTIKFSAPI